MEETHLNSTMYNYNNGSDEYSSSDAPKQQGKSIAEAMSNPSTLTISLLLFLLIVVTLGGNFLVCFTVYVTKRLHVAAFFFVVSLAVADFMVGLFVIPVALAFQVAIEMKEYAIYTVEVCDAWIFLNTWFSCASILNLCAISWDRYVAVISPLQYAIRMRTSRVKVMLVFIWMASLFLSCLAWLGVKASKNRIHYCSTEGMDLKYATPVVVLLFIIPVSFLVFANTKIIIAAQSQLKKIKAQSRDISLNRIPSEQEVKPYGQRSTVHRKMDFVRIRQEIKTFKLFLIVIGVFVICWLPFFVLTIVSSVTPITAVYANIKLIFISLAYVNSACNVFIYGFHNKDFRRALALAVKRRWKSRNRFQSVSSSSAGRRNTVDVTLERGNYNEAYVSSALQR